MVYFIQVFIILLLCYLIGSILTGEIVGRIKNVDLRKQGSGNVGATNALRSFGSFYGALVLIGDALKGIISVQLGSTLGYYHGFDMAILAGVMAIIGHNWPVYSKFRGGKGVATSLGVLIALTPYSLLIALPLFVLLLLFFGYVSLASIVAAISYPISVMVFYPQNLYKIIFAAVAALMVLYRHLPNFNRLFKGEEHKISFRKKGKDEKEPANDENIKNEQQKGNTE